MFKESGPSPQDAFEDNKKEEEINPEDEKFIEENPEIGQISMIEGAESLIKNGQENNDSEKIKEGLEIISAVKEDIINPKQDDNERVSKLKKILGNVFKDLWKDHGPKAGIEDIGSFFNKIKNNESGNRFETIKTASIELSKKQGVLHLIDDIKKGLE